MEDSELFTYGLTIREYDLFLFSGQLLGAIELRYLSKQLN